MSALVPLQGRLIRDPELRFTQAGKPVASFTVVTARRYQDKSGTWQETETSFWDCSAWDKMAEGVAETLTKGSLVLLIGYMYQEEWEDKDGAKRKNWKLRVTDIGQSLKWGPPEQQESRQQERRQEQRPPARPSSRPAAIPTYDDEPPF